MDFLWWSKLDSVMHKHKKQVLWSVTLSCFQAHFHLTHICHNKYFDHTSLQQLWFWWGGGQQQRLLQWALQMMNPFTSLRTAFDDFTRGKECKQWKEKHWSCYREISISHRTEQVYAMTFQDCFINNKLVTVVLYKQILHQNMCANMKMI